jgi:hypothetical protein
MGDALDASEQALYNFDTLSMHTQFMQMIEDNQGANGDVPVVIPAGIPVFGFIFFQNKHCCVLHDGSLRFMAQFAPRRAFRNFHCHCSQRKSSGRKHPYSQRKSSGRKQTFCPARTMVEESGANCLQLQGVR